MTNAYGCGVLCNNPVSQMLREVEIEQKKVESKEADLNVGVGYRMGCPFVS